MFEVMAPDPVLVPADESDYPIVQNLARFYVYEMSRYAGWQPQPDGLYECIDLRSYFVDKDRYAFVIRVGDELAGFALIRAEGSTVDVDWDMGEFFIVGKFQRKGIGAKIATELFDRFPGLWEVAQLPENTPAIAFWKKVISQYTNGDYEDDTRIDALPEPHTMVVQRFTVTPQASPE